MTNAIWSNVVRGVAIGDAWGDPVEFRKITEIVRNNPQGPELPERLRITDDTQMTLYLADALDQASDAPMDDVKAAIEKAFLAYRDDPDSGSRAPGVTVMGSLGRIARGEAWQKATNTTSDGSGTVMRTSPVAFVADDRWVGVAAFAAAITHGSANGIAAAILNVAVLRAIMAGKVTPGNTIDAARAMASDPASYGLLNVGEWLDGYDVDIAPGFVELARLLDIAAKGLPGLRANPWGSGLKLYPGPHDSMQGFRLKGGVVTAPMDQPNTPDRPVSRKEDRSRDGRHPGRAVSHDVCRCVAATAGSL